MLQAKDFYQLTGLKRSTIRFYQRQGMLLSSRVEENGYACYDDKALIDAMLIRNYRCVEFSVQDILEQEDFSLEAQIGRLEDVREVYLAQIRELNRKVQIVDAYSAAMRNFRVTGEIMEGSTTVPLNSFYIKNALLRYPKEAREEIERCVNAFPFVHITGRGELEELEENGAVHFEPGYEYNVERGLFEPLHPELYALELPHPRLSLRIKAKEPLCLTAEELAPLTAELSRRGLPLRGRIISLISAVEQTGGGPRYLLAVRVSI